MVDDSGLRAIPIETTEQPETSCYVSITGVVSDEPVWVKEENGKIIWNLVLIILRTSGTEDFIQFTIDDSLLPDGTIPGRTLTIRGIIETTYLEVNSGAKHKRISVLAEDCYDTCNSPHNEVVIQGVICKMANEPRDTPFGRRILDICLAVNYDSKESAYIPCVAWGSTAEYISQHLSVGNLVIACGRIQSRNYEKTVKGVTEIHTVTEISISRIEIE